MYWRKIYLQLATLRKQTWVSKGKSSRVIGHDNVKDTLKERKTRMNYKEKNGTFLQPFLYLMLYRISPFGKTLMYRFGCMILWNCPCFSLRKNVSGIHTLRESTIVRYLMRPISKVLKLGLWIHNWIQVCIVRNWNSNYLLYRQMQVYYRSIVVEK